MKKHQIITLTINPSLDKSTHFSGLIAEQKMRCEKPRYDAGGGGINVSKAISKLGGSSLCVFTSGGSPGEMLEELIQEAGIESQALKTKSWTRENFIALDNTTKSQYRFGFPGNELSESEIETLFTIVKEFQTDYLVISGSLNEGLPNVILEALSCETPVVSFDCLSGPSEMISHKQNGLLVENQNVQKLTEAMNLFVEDEKLYTICKENALQSVRPFSIENIGKQWLDLMQINN